MTEFHCVQVQLAPLQHRYLQERAERQGSSISDVVRELVQADMQRQRQIIKDDPFWEIVGMVAGGNLDAGVEHAHHIYGTAKRRGCKSSHVGE